MTLTAPEVEPPHGIALPVVVIVLIIAGIIYSFGYLRAVMHRANRDYKTTKAAVPTLRKGFWRAWWGAVKIGFFVVIGAAILAFWAARDVRDGAEATTPASPSPSASHHPR